MWIALYVVVTYDLAETPKAASIIIIRTCIVHTYVWDTSGYRFCCQLMNKNGSHKGVDFQKTCLVLQKYFNLNCLWYHSMFHFQHLTQLSLSLHK